MNKIICNPFDDARQCGMVMTTTEPASRLSSTSAAASPQRQVSLHVRMPQATWRCVTNRGKPHA